MLYDSLKAENRESEYIKFEGRITSAGNFAEALAGVAGGLLATISLRTPYYFQIVVAAIAIPAAFFLKEPKHIQERVHLKMKEILSIVKLTYLQPEMRSAILISSFTGAATLTYAWFVQPYFEKAGVPVSVFGILWTLLNLSAGVFSMFSYRIERLLGRKSTLLLIISLLSLGFILTSVEISFAGIAILFGFYMVRGVATPVLKDYINQYTNNLYSEIYSLNLKQMIKKSKIVRNLQYPKVSLWGDLEGLLFKQFLQLIADFFNRAFNLLHRGFFHFLFNLSARFA